MRFEVEEADPELVVSNISYGVPVKPVRLNISWLHQWRSRREEQISFLIRRN